MSAQSEFLQMPPFQQIFKGSYPDCSLEACTSNVNSVALTVSELLALNAQKFRAMPLCEKLLRDHIRTVPGNMRVKFEVCSFNCFKLVWLTGPLHTDTHTETHTKQKQYLRHSLVHLAEKNIGLLKLSTSPDWRKFYSLHSLASNYSMWNHTKKSPVHRTCVL